jgi:hypothetical protein
MHYFKEGEIEKESESVKVVVISFLQHILYLWGKPRLRVACGDIALQPWRGLGAGTGLHVAPGHSFISEVN